MDVFKKALLLVAYILVYFSGEIENYTWMHFGEPFTLKFQYHHSSTLKVNHTTWYRYYPTFQRDYIYMWTDGRVKFDDRFKSLIDLNRTTPVYVSSTMTRIDLHFPNVTFQHEGLYKGYMYFPGAEPVYSREFETKVYRITKPEFTTGLCNMTVGLTCKATNIYPKPQMEFLLYNKATDKSTKLEGELYMETRQQNHSKYFDISGKIIVPYEKFQNVPNAKAQCKVKILLERFNHTRKSVFMVLSNTKKLTRRKRTRCLANLRMEKHEYWYAVGEGPVLFRCTFDIPYMDNIKSVHWSYYNVSRDDPFYEWDEHKAKVTIEDKYKADIPEKTLIMPFSYEGKMATALMFREAKPELEGNYTCRVNFVKAGGQSDTSLLIVYELKEPFRFIATWCRDNQTVGLYCNVMIAYRKPLEMAFYAHLPYTRKQERLNYPIYMKIREIEGWYGIRGKMIVPIDQFRLIYPAAKCEVILQWDPPINRTRMRHLADPDRSDNRECIPPVHIKDKREVWQENGTGPVVFRCRIHIPYNDTIKTIQWIHENHPTPLYQWNSTTNKLQYNQRYEDLIPIFPNVLEDRIIVTLEFKRATLKNSGKYSCQAIFDKSKNQSATANLNVYQLPKNYTIKATRCPDNKTVGLSCNVKNLIHKPLDMLFYVHNPDSKRQHLLNYPIYIKMEDEKNNVYGMSGEMIVPFDRFSERHQNAKFECEVILNRDPLVRGSERKEIEHPQNSDECVPHLQIEKHDVWYKEGSKVTLVCIFDIPFNDSIASIKWFHQNFSKQKPFYKWIKKKNRTTIKEEYKEDLKNEQSEIIPKPFYGGKNITKMIFEKARLKHLGNYTCRVTFGRDAQSELATTQIVVYRIQEPYDFIVKRCKGNRTELVCKAGGLYPAPIDIEFLVGRGRDTSEKLDNVVSIEIEKVNEYYNVTGKTILHNRLETHKTITCVVVLKKDLVAKKAKYVEENKEENRDTCSPSIEIMENHTQWVSVGTGPLSMRCRFELRQGDETESIEWFHHEFSMHKPIYKRNRDGSEATELGYNVKGSSITNQIMNLTFQQVNPQYSGQYSCKVTFRIAGKHNSNTTNLIVFQLNKPEITAFGCSDRKVLLECKTGKVFPEPIIKFFRCDSNKFTELNNATTVDIKKVKELYDITATMITSFLDHSGKAKTKVACFVILPKNHEKNRVSDCIERRVPVAGDICFPNVEIDPPTQWARVGGNAAVMRCKYEHPTNDHIKSIDWFHQALKEDSVIPMKQIYKDDFFDIYNLPHESQSVLKFEKVKLEHGGRYFCRVNFQLAGNQSGNGSLEVYQMHLPIFFVAQQLTEDQVEFECNAINVFPKPANIVLSEYNPATKLKSMLAVKPSISIKEANSSFRISAKLTTSLNKLKGPQYACDVIVKDHEAMETSFTSLTSTLETNTIVGDQSEDDSSRGGGEMTNALIANAATIVGGTIAPLILWFFWCN